MIWAKANKKIKISLVYKNSKKSLRQTAKYVFVLKARTKIELFTVMAAIPVFIRLATEWKNSQKTSFIVRCAYLQNYTQSKIRREFQNTPKNLLVGFATNKTSR